MDADRNPVSRGFTKAVREGLQRLVLPRGLYDVTASEGIEIAEQDFDGSTDPIALPTDIKYVSFMHVT